MRLTKRLLQNLIEEEKRSLSEAAELRDIVRRQVCSLLEAGPKPGSEGSEAEGSLDVKKIADTLGLDPGKLKTAITNIRGGKRNSTDNAIFGDMMAKLLDASPEDTVKAMNVLKKVSSEEKK